jgi:drug/metabolite transporter (DMT)-like permease
MSSEEAVLGDAVSGHAPRPGSAKAHVTAAYVAWLPILAATLWGTAFPAISLGLEGFRPGALAFWRAVIAALSLGMWLLASGRLELPRAPGAWARLMFLSLAGTGVFWSAQILAVRLSDPVNTAFLIGIYPAAITALAPLLLGEPLRRRNFLALGSALTGAYLVISNGALLSLFASETLAGDLLAVLAAASFGAYLILGRRWRDRLGVSSEGLTLYTFVLSLPVLALLGLLDGGLGGEVGLRSAGGLLWLGLGCSTAAFLALNRAVRAGAVTRSSLHLMAMPLVAALASWLMFGSTLRPLQWVGGGLVLLGIGLARS